MRLVTRGLTVRFGGLEALAGVDVAVAPGETVGVIGPNGSGKTTLFNAISGLYRAAAGEIHLEGRSLTDLEPHAIARLGVARTFQASRLCLGLSVFDNVLVGMHARRRTGLVDAVLRRHRFRAEARAGIAEASRLLALFSPGLVDRGFDRVGQLPQIDRRRVEICRALALRPRLLLLDEPSMGLAPVLVEQIFETIQDINRQGTPILLVEQNAAVALTVAHRGYVLETGSVVLEGPARTLAADAGVRAAYLGEGA
jgi:ABC-type branched-subunit amino acid transport system ATPase component